MMLLMAFAGGAVLGFCVARSVTYERWLRERRDLRTLRRQSEIHDRLQKWMEE
jgi:hypothetical protein